MNNMTALLITSFIIVITVVGMFSLLIDCLYVEKYVDETLKNHYKTTNKNYYELVNNDYEYKDYLEK